MSAHPVSPRACVHMLTLGKKGRRVSHFKNSNQPIGVGMWQDGNQETGGENLQLICVFEDKLNTESSLTVKMSTK